jgi:superfamily II DNA or RNA helicase
VTASALVLTFDEGTLLLDGAEEPDRVPPQFVWDERVARWRAPALGYRDVVEHLTRSGVAFDDRARGYENFDFRRVLEIEPRPYQTDAIREWRKAGRRGVVILPTGAGKTFVAELAIELTGRSTLVIVPTIDLMNQWYDLLLAGFKAEVGLVGGGYFEIGAITVTTYASAFRFMERLGGRFGFIVYDECHHLPSSVYRYAAEMAIAPFRLGLTATPEREDGADAMLDRLIGPTVYRRQARDLAGEYLSDYSLVRVEVHLTAAEREAYERARAVFRGFVQDAGIGFGGIDGWQRFVIASARSEAGRRAMQAYRESKRIALGTDAKLRVLHDILRRHRHDRLIVFTAENDMVYRVSQQFLVPAITHETPIKERRDWLEAFNSGAVLALATSKVLNEGVNIPDASVAVVLSGSGSTREHIQRLGRILRKRPDKEAVLYEVVAVDTTEENISRRRGADEAVC